MKVRFYHWYNALLSTLLTILGFGSCTNVGEDEYGSPVICEYGTPWANYEVKGVVTDEAGAPIPGIKTSIKELYKWDGITNTVGRDSTLTDGKGNFLLNGMGKSYEKLIIEDTDGKANGEYQSDTLDIDYDKAVQIGEGDNHWYQGLFQIIQNVKLRKK